jgi:hypothetical protein
MVGSWDKQDKFHGWLAYIKMGLPTRYEKEPFFIAPLR